LQEWGGDDQVAQAPEFNYQEFHRVRWAINSCSEGLNSIVRGRGFVLLQDARVSGEKSCGGCGSAS